MHIALYSNQVSSQLDEFTAEFLREIENKKPRITYLASCPDPDRKFFEDRKQYYSRFEAELSAYFDLEDHWEKYGETGLFDSDAIHLSGGDTFRFLYWIKNRNLPSRLTRYVKNGGSLIGVSAGAIILCISIETSSLLDEVNSYTGIDFEGIGLANFHFYPHYNYSNKNENKAIKFSRQHHEVLYAIQDHQAIAIKDSKIDFINGATAFTSGIKQDIKGNRSSVVQV